MDMEVLSDIIMLLSCPDCHNNIMLNEKCSVCDFSKQFFSSAKNEDRCYDINKRMVLFYESLRPRPRWYINIYGIDGHARFNDARFNDQ